MEGGPSPDLAWLLDRSGGRGTPVSLDDVPALPDFPVGIAGGLGPDDPELLRGCDAGQWPQALWEAVEESGFALAGAPLEQQAISEAELLTALEREPLRRPPPPGDGAAQPVSEPPPGPDDPAAPR